jgi:hypothetical protein
MVAGTMLRGMFEDRIQNVIREIKERPNLILFIDEVHTMIGAGGQAGQGDAANLQDRGDERGRGARRNESIFANWPTPMIMQYGGIGTPSE